MGQVILGIEKLDFHWKTLDPFLFCAYHRDDYPVGNAEFGPDAPLSGRNIGQDFQIKDGWRMYHGEKVPGFPSHPHRGFETITIVEDGLVDHADSMGGAGRYGNGDVQWLTTGKGIQHSEMFPLINQDAKNPLLLFQIWLNLPAEKKMEEPHFAMYWKEDIPVMEKEIDGGAKATVKLIAGELSGKKAPEPPPASWASNPVSDILICLVTLSPEAEWSLEASQPGLNRMLYFYEGSDINLNGEAISSGHGIRLTSDEDINIKNGSEESHLLLLQGRPLNEPVAHYGPFVMNTREQLEQAFNDYRQDQFGGWNWDTTDQVHANKGRFALYPDGTEEHPEQD